MEPKGYLARAEQQIGLCVADICGPLRKLAEQLGAAGGGPTSGPTSGERMQDILNQVCCHNWHLLQTNFLTGHIALRSAVNDMSAAS